MGGDLARRRCEALQEPWAPRQEPRCDLCSLPAFQLPQQRREIRRDQILRVGEVRPLRRPVRRDIVAPREVGLVRVSGAADMLEQGVVKDAGDLALVEIQLTGQRRGDET